MSALIHKGHALRADVVTFPETAMSGYPGEDIKSWDGYDWEALRKAEESLRELAREIGIGVIYGTSRRFSAADVRNSLVYIAQNGSEEARYDKRFCTTEELKYYKSGQRFTTFEINGFKCGMLICYDSRFPELYREYKKRNVEVMFHSFYQCRAKEKKKNNHTMIIRPTLQAYAACNYMYISAPNPTGCYQSWPSVFILPDGMIAQSCRQHRTGLIVNEISSDAKFYDASAPFRKRALQGVLFSE